MLAETTTHRSGDGHATSSCSHTRSTTGRGPSPSLFVRCSRADLSLRYSQLVIPRAGSKPFLMLLVATAAADAGAAAPLEAPPLVLRDAEGRRTAAHLAIRRWTMGGYTESH